MAQQQARLFRQARELDTAGDRSFSVGSALRSGQGGEGYTLIMRPDGTVEIKVEGRGKGNRPTNGIDRIGALMVESYVQKLVAEAVARLVTQPATKTEPASGVQVKPIGKVVARWLADIGSSTLPKTLKIKAAAVEGFARHHGEKQPLTRAGRLEVGRWIESLRASGLATPTIVNKVGYLKGFFDWSRARGYYPDFSKDDNPAAGQILFRKKEKRARRVHGFKAFSPDHVRILYSPEALVGLSETAQWGAWIGLYTGARVAEVGQLALVDFVTQDGVPSIRITNEGMGQSVKNDASLRTIPIHPALLALGLLDRVDELRAAGEVRLFPRVKMDGVNGAGNWLSKAFTRHVTAHIKLPEKGKFGFHSLRKSVVQGLQTAGVSSELRAAYVGHELGDEHHGAYSRKPTMRELLAEVSRLKWWDAAAQPTAVSQ
jgi:integrase